MIAVVDYGMGNVGSIVNMLKKVGSPGVASADPSVLRSATKLILPGVGAFDAGMAELARRGFVDLLKERVVDGGVPLLGICLGMQLIGLGSEEGKLAGLGWIDARSVRFRFSGNNGSPRVPHMGWNSLTLTRPDPLWEGLEDEARFYFVHSFHMECAEPADVLATTHYGYDFPSVIGRGHVLGTQFHPEKSHKYGLRLLRNFAQA